MKHVLYFLFISLLALACQNQDKPVEDHTDVESEIINDKIGPLWRKAKFDSAVGIILNGDNKLYFNLDAMDSSYAPETRRRLSDAQLHALSAQLSGQVEVESEPSECFQPYHGIFFYQNGEVAGRLAMCFSCNTFYTNPENSGNINLHMLKKMFSDWGLPTYDWNNEAETASSTTKYGDYFR
ncbi:MAG: hypothetical protein EP332_08700 [Bacteroidetes bacterium]|nr:MAG: hypothetical protein EP332_08700 [Bacteroidota bacterium]